MQKTIAQMAILGWIESHFRTGDIHIKLRERRMKFI